MNDEISQLTATLKLRSGANPVAIAAAEEALEIKLPSDYRDFLIASDGGEGPIGPTSYLSLWAVEDLPTRNQSYAVQEFAPGLVVFGSDGANTAYAFDCRSTLSPIVQVPFVGMDLEEVAPCGGGTLRSFLEYLRDR